MDENRRGIRNFAEACPSRVTAGRTRSWAETRYPVLRVDAWQLKICEEGQVRATSGFVVTGDGPGVARDPDVGDR